MLQGCISSDVAAVGHPMPLCPLCQKQAASAAAATATAGHHSPDVSCAASLPQQLQLLQRAPYDPQGFVLCHKVASAAWHHMPPQPSLLSLLPQPPWFGIRQPLQCGTPFLLIRQPMQCIARCGTSSNPDCRGHEAASVEARDCRGLPH